MLINLNLSGTIKVIHVFQTSGGSPPATLADLNAMESRLMSALSDKIAAVGADLDAATARVQAEVTTLTDQIAALQATIDAGGATPADLAALDALDARLQGLVPTVPAPPANPGS